MQTMRLTLTIVVMMLIGISSSYGEDEFDKVIKPLIVKRCAKCHGEDEVNGDVNLKEIEEEYQLADQPALIELMIDVIDARTMPPEDEPSIDEKTRKKVLSILKKMLKDSTSTDEPTPNPVQRLNRFQYNNAVRDLFELNKDVFPLKEKLLTRNTDYLNNRPERLPDQINVVSLALRPQPGLTGVNPFPKDLRASHGFDNQANQLTLSPLLLDAFLRLSVSIVESPDFVAGRVGIWNRFLKEPEDPSQFDAELHNRIRWFLRRAFRGPVEQATIDRYVKYAASKIEEGSSFEQAMKKIASAAMSSPLFLFRAPRPAEEADFELATRLSFFLWNSIPDENLLALAEQGKLSDPEVLSETIDRMLRDQKVERFLDSFPAQWMQLENVLAATPDPQKYRYYSFDKTFPASVQMLVEPLVLFDAVFVEDRPVIELVNPDFGYQSDFLQTWYTENLNPPPIDQQAIEQENNRRIERKQELNQAILQIKQENAAIEQPLRQAILAARKLDADVVGLPDLKPMAVWEFDGSLEDEIGGLHLKPNGKVEFEDGSVILNRSYLLSEKIPVDLRQKSLEVRFQLNNLDQPGGGLMGIQGPGDFFDTIVIGERKPRQWISGSNGFSRTDDFPKSSEETVRDDWIHLVMTYEDNGTTRLYRNGKSFGGTYRKGAATFPKDNSSVIFGLRHLPAGGNRYLNVRIDRAQLYNRQLSDEEVEIAFQGNGQYVSDDELVTAMSAEQRQRHASLNEKLSQQTQELAKVPAPTDINQMRDQRQKEFDNRMRSKLRSTTFRRVTLKDPRYGGVITNAAILSMTSGPKRTHPIARGAWIIEVIFNDPPPPPPNDVPPLNEEQSDENLTIREKFAVHRENPDCAGCHSRLDPLGFALENYDIAGRWRDRYENGREVDASGTLLKTYQFDSVTQFKESLVAEDERFARALIRHLLRYAVGRELQPSDSIAVDQILESTQGDNYRLQGLIKAVALSPTFNSDRRHD